MSTTNNANPTKRYSSSINLEKELSKKLYSSASRPHKFQQGRNPITQCGIPEQETNLPSDSHPRGPARGEFSQKGQGSFKFGSSQESVPFTPAVKRADCMPINRNPITQDHPSLAPPCPRQDRAQYAKVRDSTVFSSVSECDLLHSPRQNQ